MATMRIPAIIRFIEAREKSLAKERDKIDDLISELEGRKEIAERAMDALHEAREALSELV